MGGIKAFECVCESKSWRVGDVWRVPASPKEVCVNANNNQCPQIRVGILTILRRKPRHANQSTL